MPMLQCSFLNYASVQMLISLLTNRLTHLQAAIATTPPGTASDPPRAGDGFTFEHLADRPQLWLDFCADTGDGGDPTYAVARAMAAPGLKVCPAVSIILIPSSMIQIQFCCCM